MLAMTEWRLSLRTLIMDPRSYESKIDDECCCTTVSPWIQSQLNTNVLEVVWIASMKIPRSLMFPIAWCCSLNIWAYGTVYIDPGYHDDYEEQTFWPNNSNTLCPTQSWRAQRINKYIRSINPAWGRKDEVLSENNTWEQNDNESPMKMARYQ